MDSTYNKETKTAHLVDRLRVKSNLLENDLVRTMFCKFKYVSTFCNQPRDFWEISSDKEMKKLKDNPIKDNLQPNEGAYLLLASSLYLILLDTEGLPGSINYYCRLQTEVWATSLVCVK